MAVLARLCGASSGWSCRRPAGCRDATCPPRAA